MNQMKCVILLACFLGILIKPTLQAKDDRIEADYVIVGVGTAGAVLAKKLSDDKQTSVIALHRGENLNKDPLIKLARNAVITVPALLFGSSDLYEVGETIPQSNADNRELEWGLSLPEGGATSINAGAWCRGTNELYSQWEAIAGPEWSVNRILKIYKELENYHGQTDNPRFRGHHGPISIFQDNDPSKVSKKFTRAIIETTGVPFVLDYNDPKTPIGASTQVQYSHSGRLGRLRVSSGTAFLNEKVVTPSGFGVKGRKLRILFESRALRTLWEGNKAIGVEFLKDGVIQQVFAKKGVIVCAGLFSSPFLLHSGVGPANLLRSLNIPVIFDNPNVGQGLADQPGLRLFFTSNPKDSASNPNNFFAQIAWLPAPGGDPNIREVRFATVNQVPEITLLLLDLCQPRSRGTISIASSNPLDPPVIDLGLLSNPDDLDLFQAAMQVYVKGINDVIHAKDPAYKLLFPDPAILDDPELVRAFISEEVATNEHFQSHCRMAPINQGGVVDSTGHVYGTENLIVADDSISPMDMDGSPMASAYLIAANIARLLIKNEK